MAGMLKGDMMDRQGAESTGGGFCYDEVTPT